MTEKLREDLTGRCRPTGPLTAHVQECDECSTDSPPVEQIQALLNAGCVDVDPAALSQQVRIRLRSEMAARAAAFRRRVVVGVLLALLPLPLVLVYDAYLLGVVYGILTILLPSGVAAYVLLSYAACLLFLFALTYAAVPLLLDRNPVSRRMLSA